MRSREVDSDSFFTTRFDALLPIEEEPFLSFLAEDDSSSSSSVMGFLVVYREKVSIRPPPAHKCGTHRQELIPAYRRAHCENSMRMLGLGKAHAAGPRRRPGARSGAQRA